VGGGFADLLARGRQGDQEALNELFERWRPLLRLQVRHTLGRDLAARVDTSDVLQETLTQAFRDLMQSLAGTLAYMAPEQARGQGERIDPRTDVFGLGAVCYHLLTGHPPHQAANRDLLLEAAKGGDIVPPRQVTPTVPAALEAICLRCLAADPVNRFQSAAELAQALDRWLRRRRRWAIPAGIAAGLLVAAFGVCWGLGLFSSDPPHPAPPPPALTNDQQEGVEKASPGRSLHRDFDLKVRLVVSGKPVPVREQAYHLADGQEITFEFEPASSCYLRLLQVTRNGEVVKLFPNQWDKDRRFEGGKKHRLPGEDDEAVYTAAASPGREHLHFIASTQLWKEEPTNPKQSAGPFAVFPKDLDKDGTPKVLSEFRDIQVKRRTVRLSEVILPVEVSGPGAK